MCETGIRSKPKASKAPLILVVEDEAIVRMDLVAELEAQGFQVVEAADGVHALTLIDTRPDLASAVIDIGLPNGISGYEIVTAIRKERPDCPIIIASAQNIRLPADFDEHVIVEAKPYDVAKIALILRHATRDDVAAG